jgi:hypothetical protein
MRMRHVTGGRSWDGEFLARRRGGTRFPPHMTLPVLDRFGEVIALIGVSHAIEIVSPLAWRQNAPQGVPSTRLQSRTCPFFHQAFRLGLSIRF